MSALDDAIKGFTPVFGNQEHIHLMSRIKEYRRMQNFPTKAKSTKERMRLLRESIIYQIEKLKSHDTHD